MKKLLFPLFIIVCILQLFVPGQMAWFAKDVLVHGEIFKFKTIPVDPNDPFRGKYVTLRFAAQNYTVDTLQWQDWQVYDTFYAYLQKDANDFVTIERLSPFMPTENKPYLVTKKRSSTSYKDSVDISLQFPFERFYMEESKAPIAERIFRDASRSTQEQTYATVRVKNGDAVLEEVMVGEETLRDLAAKEMENKR